MNELVAVDTSGCKVHAPAKMFKFHIVTYLNEKLEQQKLVCMDYIAKESLITMYSIREPKMYHPTSFDEPFEYAFNMQTLSFTKLNNNTVSMYGHYVPEENTDSIHEHTDYYEFGYIEGYGVLECKTIGTDKILTIDSHSVDPNEEDKNVWYRIDKNEAHTRTSINVDRHNTRTTKRNHTFVSDSNMKYEYERMIDKVLRKARDEAVKKADRDYEKIIKKYKTELKEYNELGFWAKRSAEMPIEPEKESVELPTIDDVSLDGKVCRDIVSDIEQFNERYDNQLDLSSVYKYFKDDEN